MNESLFQFIWQHSLYNATQLFTTKGEPVVILNPGRINRNAGPDFNEAKIRVGNTVLVGNVELHIKTSDWLKHGHQNDPAYANLAMHVVFEHDVPDIDNRMPTLVLGAHIASDIPARYSSLVNNPEKLPCGRQHEQVRSITKESWLSRLLAERWEQKLSDWNVMLQNSSEDWRNLLYWRIAANFGFKTNAAPFLDLARSLPLNIATRHKDNLMQLEALYFGQAGLLDADFSDEYPRLLQREYDYLKKKYSLKPIMPGSWKFLRMRPVNFPSLRIAQFAALVHVSVHLFSQIIETHSVKDILNILDVNASEYWNNHYRFDVSHDKPFVKSLGKSSIENIIINTIAPIQFLYAARQGTPVLQERALQLLEAVPFENNNIVRIWEDSGWRPANAAQSQAMIQLYNNYCIKKRCLECAVGLNIIKKR